MTDPTPRPDPAAHDIPPDEAHFSPVSFMDPQARVFEWRGDLYRALRGGAERFALDFLETPQYRRLVDGHRLIETRRTDHRLEGYAAVLAHRRVETPTYCFEWPAAMLKEAALLTVDLCLELLDADATLQDAYPWNVLFEGPQPVHVDYTSIAPLHEHILWIPYQQFCNFFYHPLLLYSAGHDRVVRGLLMDYLQGVPPEDAARMLKLRHKLSRPGYLARVGLPLALSRWVMTPEREASLRRLNERVARAVPRRARQSFFRKLRRDVARLPLQGANTAWSSYYRDTPAEELQRKQALFATVLERTKPRTVLDIGCNAGVFSLQAAGQGARVVAMDTDPASVGALYHEARRQGADVQPLVMDVLNPSPAFGWCGRQFAPAAERIRAELVCAFAVMHHLVFTHGQDFHRVIESIRAFQEDWALFEFVDRTDPQSVRIRRRIGFDDSWYELERFKAELGKHYASVETVGDVSPTRTLLLCRK